MTILTSIPLTTAAQFRQHDTTLTASRAVLAEIQATAALITPDALAFIAADASAEREKVFADSLAELRDEVIAPLAMLANLSARLGAAIKEAEDKFRPTMFAVDGRRMQIEQRLAEIPKSIKISLSGVEDARKRYTAAGLRADEADRLVQHEQTQVDASIAAQKAEETALRSELEALNNFRASRNPEDLPDGFSIPAPLEKVRFSGYAG